MNSTYENLIQEILNELFLQRPRSQESMEVCTKEFCDEISRAFTQYEWIYANKRNTDISSSGEMKTSLKLMI